jgi:hypothetical protein
LIFDTCLGQAIWVADLSEQAALADLESRLTSIYSNIPRDQILSVIQDAHAEFEESRIRDFVPLFVERRARAQLAEAGRLVSTG